jgi:hypothetical protein
MCAFSRKSETYVMCNKLISFKLEFLKPYISYQKIKYTYPSELNIFEQTLHWKPSTTM